MPAPEFVNKQTPEPITKVRPVPGFEEYAPQAAFGGGKSSKDAEELASVSGEMWQKHKEDADDAYVKGLYAQASEIADRHITGPNGILNQTLADGIGPKSKPGSTQVNIDTTFAAMEDDWSKLKTNNGEQEKMFGVMKAKLHADMFESVMKKASLDTIEQGRQNTEKLNAAATTLAMGDFDHAEDRLREVQANSEHARMGKEETEPDFNYRVTHAMMNAGQYERARQWKDDPNHYYGKMADRMDKEFETAQKSHDVQTAYHQIITTSGDEKSAIAKVDKIDDAKQQKQVRSLVQGFFTAHTRALEDGEMHSFLNISNNLEPGKDPTTMTGFTLLSAKHQADLIRQADPNFQGNMNVAKQWNMMTSEEIKNMPKSKFYDDVYSKLPKPDRSDAEKMWKFQQDPKNNGRVMPENRIRDAIRVALMNAGQIPKDVTPTNWSEDDLNAYNSLRIYVQNEVDNQQSGNKNVSTGDLNKIIQSAFNTKYKTGTFGKRDVSGFISINGVEPKVQMGIIRHYSQYELTDDQIKALASAIQNNDGKLYDKIDDEIRKK